jgi:hypothetical protein
MSSTEEATTQSKLVTQSEPDVDETAGGDVSGDEYVEEEYVEEAEPILSYTRMKNDVLKILEQDSVSCIRAGHKVFFFWKLID